MNVDDMSGARWRRVLRKVAYIGYLRMRNFLPTAVTGDVPLVVSLTSYGPRFKDAGLAIEAIAAGRVKPQRIILWVADGDLDLADNPLLRRLQKRGLEIRETQDYRSFKKLYPYAADPSRTLPMVTADDDILYPRQWLEMLWRAHQQTPDVLVGLRAHRVSFSDSGDALAPYSTWVAAGSDEPSFATFFTSGHGIVVTPRVLDAVRDAGEEFMDVCLHADDIWLYVRAVEAGVRNRWIQNDVRALGVPGSQAVALHHDNVSGGRNDGYLERLVRGEILRRIRQDAAH